MKKIFWFIVIITVAGYIGYNKMGGALKRPSAHEIPTSDEVECTVQKRDCAELVVMLNAIRPTRYYQAVNKLLGVSETDATLYRDGTSMVSVLPSHTKIVHNVYAGGSEKGTVMFIFPDGGWMKFDARGNLLDYQD